MQTKSMTNQDLKRIETHEWHLWLLAFLLILFLGSIAGVACFIILSEAGENLTDQRMATTALGGMDFLIVLFCAYITQTRITFGKE